MPKNELTVNARNFDGTISKSWSCTLVERSGSLLVLRGEFDREIDHEHLGRIEMGTLSYEYYWLDRWYNVFRFHHPDGLFRNYYCNINMLPSFTGAVLDYIDLDIDIVADNAGNYRILDEEEYESHALHYAYPDAIRIKVNEAVAEVKEKIRTAEFPFNLTEQSALPSVS